MTNHPQIPKTASWWNCGISANLLAIQWLPNYFRYKEEWPVSVPYIAGIRLLFRVWRIFCIQNSHDRDQVQPKLTSLCRGKDKRMGEHIGKRSWLKISVFCFFSLFRNRKELVYPGFSQAPNFVASTTLHFKQRKTDQARATLNKAQKADTSYETS